MKKIVLFLSIVTCFLFFTGSANAFVVFEDNFEDYDFTSSVWSNLTSLTKPGDTSPTWVASDGTFDVIGVGTPYDYFGGAYGQYLDLDGSSSNASDIYASGDIDAGDYLLSFDLAGNHRNASFEQVTVSVALAGFSEAFSLSQNEGFTTFTRVFTIDTPGTGSLMFSSFGGDNVGMLLDNVKIESVGSTVPEPATIVLFATGLAGFAVRRRKA